MLSYLSGFMHVFGWYVLIAICIPNINIKQRIIVAVSLFTATWIGLLNSNTYPLGSNKYTILSNIPNEYLPKQMIIKSQYDMDHVLESFTFPIILKPTHCTRSGKNVVKLNNKKELFSYSKKIINSSYMIQEFVEDEIELCILIEKWPWEKSGRIISVIEKTIKDDIRNGCSVNTCVERLDLFPYFMNIIPQISNMIPGFNVGRYDIKCSSTGLKEGKFKVLEVNGTMGFDFRGFVNPMTSILYHERWFIVRVLIGYSKICMLEGYNLVMLIIVSLVTIKNTIVCGDLEKLSSLYS